MTVDLKRYQVKAGKLDKLLANLPSKDELRASRNKIEARVAELLVDYPEVKGSYTLLWYRYIWRYHLVKFPEGFFEHKLFLMLPSTESVSRAYRKLKERGYVSETLKRKLIRASNEQVYRE